ncbi:hypothetical protein DFQ27_001631 [Actinomortierella ambigua]|uniref:Uncharacterized protein n=1 Tax=Actinomortierella ambigua TaxID=1343610 RepID=A0A9P6QAR4_9FUNG|nr:hypothetical protein DFQ27_001631 [Actinomortierella ambigua]
MSRHQATPFSTLSDQRGFKVFRWIVLPIALLLLGIYGLNAVKLIRVEDFGKAVVLREETIKEEVHREEVHKEEVPKEEVQKEEVHKEEAHKEEALKVEVHKEEVHKEEVHKEGVHKEEAHKEKARSYLTHQFTDAGIGHKFAELLFSVNEAQLNGVEYCLNEPSFLQNSRGDDYSFLVTAIYAVFPKCRTDEPPRYVTSGFEFCGEGHDSNCFFLPKRFYNDLSMFKLPSPQQFRGDGIGVHLRFGDTQANGDIDYYNRNIGHIRGLTGLKRLTFCYHTNNEGGEPLLLQLRQAFPEAKFVNARAVKQTASCLMDGRVMLTSGSSLSYMIAYLCKDCTVFFSQPKEFYESNSPYDVKVNSKTSIYYVDRYTALA